MNIIHNMDQYLSRRGAKKNLSPSEKVLLERCEGIIFSALSLRRGESPVTVACNSMTGDATCTSHLHISITDVPNEIRWECTCCGTNGVIQNWRKSLLSSEPAVIAKTNRRESATMLTLPADFYTVLEESCTGNPELMMLLSMAERGEDTCSFHAAEFDRNRFLNTISGRAAACNDEKFMMLEKILRESV